jgi:hypothetical protein
MQILVGVNSGRCKFLWVLIPAMWILTGADSGGCEFRPL